MTWLRKSAASACVNRTSAARSSFSWPRTRQRIEESLAEYQAVGCCTSFGEWQPEVNAVAVMLLVEQGRVSLDDPMLKYFPDFAHPDVVRGIRPAATSRTSATRTW